MPTLPTLCITGKVDCKRTRKRDPVSMRQSQSKEFRVNNLIIIFNNNVYSD